MVGFPLDQLTFFELLALQNQLRVVGDLAEIGIWQGKFGSFIIT